VDPAESLLEGRHLADSRDLVKRESFDQSYGRDEDTSDLRSHPGKTPKARSHRSRKSRAGSHSSAETKRIVVNE